ncbi:hypothetical protein, partial [Pseudoalteromonas sp.]|uniref:portal protein n=1 Tax=Pseudoalteromonas sp. TaxID=53249 RepID=UPI00261486C6
IDGMCGQQIYFDPSADNGRGELKLTDIETRDLYIDPNARRKDCQDAAHILISKIFTGEYIQAHYPGFNFDGAEEEVDSEGGSTRAATIGQILDANDIYHRKYRLIDRYSKVIERMYDVYSQGLHYEKLLKKKEYEEFLSQKVAGVTKVGEPIQYITKPVDVEEMIELYKQLGGGKNFKSKVTYHVNAEGQAVVGAEGEGDVPNSTSLLEIMNMRQLVKTGELIVNKIDKIRIQRVISIGRKFYYKEVLPLSVYPISLTQLHDNRNPYPMGDVRLVKPLQEQLNKNESLLTTYLTQATSFHAFLPEGSVTDKADLEEKLGIAGTHLHYYNAELGGTGITVLQVPPLPNGAYQRSSELRSTIQRILGAYAFQDGQFAGAPQTFKGTHYIDQMGQRRSRLKRADIEDMINLTGKIISEYVPYVYTQEKTIRILDPNGQTQEIIFNRKIQSDSGAAEIANNITISQFDLQIVTGSMLAVDNEMELERLERLWDKGILRDNIPILRKSNLDNLDEIIERNDIIPQLQQQIQAMEAEIKKLQGDMQTKDRELETADRQISKSKFDADLSSAKSKVEAQVQLTQQRLGDKVKDDKRASSKEDK